MVMRYTTFDIAATTIGLQVRIFEPPADPKNPAEQKDILFQFPPHVSNDSRGGDWDEHPGGPEAGDQIAVYKAARPRRITLEWQYIVDGGDWTADVIHTQLKLLRGYFRNPFTKAKGNVANSPMIIELLLWEFGGKKPMTFRLHDVNVKHGKALMFTNDGGIFALETTVSGEFKSWPNVGIEFPAQLVPGQKTFTNDWF